MFQSAPALCRAGDLGVRVDRERPSGFNPRPLFAERATSRGRCLACCPQVSIRARSLQSGRLALAPDSCITQRVSIRARSLQSGRQDAARHRSGSRTFQSAPALCRAGDRNAAGLRGCGENVSIRARSLQSGRRRSALLSDADVRFQSAPALCRAGDLELSRNRPGR